MARNSFVNMYPEKGSVHQNKYKVSYEIKC